MVSSSAVSPPHFHRSVARCHSRRPRSVASSSPVVGSSIRTTAGTVHITHHGGICPSRVVILGDRSCPACSERDTLPAFWDRESRRAGEPESRRAGEPESRIYGFRDSRFIVRPLCWVGPVGSIPSGITLSASWAEGPRRSAVDVAGLPAPPLANGTDPAYRGPWSEGHSCRCRSFLTFSRAASSACCSKPRSSCC